MAAVAAAAGMSARGAENVFIGVVHEQGSTSSRGAYPEGNAQDGPMSKPPAFIQEEGEDGEDEDYGNRPKIATRKGGTDVDGLKDDSSFCNCDPCYWTHGQVMAWLSTTPWKNYGPVFHEHGITGHHLALLDRPELASMGMRRVADQMDFLEAIPVERSVYGSRPTDVPNKFMALFEAMISTKYARTSKGKTPAQIKEEFMSINNCVALLSALLMTVSFDFLTWGYGEMEELMDKTSAILFVACAFISGLFFAMSLMMAIFQMIMCTQMTSNTSTYLFVELMDQARLFPVRTMCWGVKFLLAFLFILIFRSKHIGVILGDGDYKYYGLGAVLICGVIFMWFLSTLAFGVQATYIARIHQVDQYAADRFPNARERYLAKIGGESCPTLYPTEKVEKQVDSAEAACYSRVINSNGQSMDVDGKGFIRNSMSRMPSFSGFGRAASGSSRSSRVEAEGPATNSVVD